MQANMVNRQTFSELELFCWSLPKYRSIRNAFKWFCETFISLLNEKFKRQKWNNKKRQSNIFCISSLTSTRSQQKPFSNRKDESYWKKVLPNILTWIWLGAKEVQIIEGQVMVSKSQLRDRHSAIEFRNLNNKW